MKKKLNLLKFSLITCAVMFCFYLSAQESKSKVGFIYVEGIKWTENEKQDSVINIFIEKDTMQVVRNLLIYCLFINDEKNAANFLLSTINLDQLQKVVNNNHYNIAYGEYKKVIFRNKKYFDNKYPKYAK